MRDIRASNLNRIVACGGSVDINAGLRVPHDNSYSLEGTAAHWVAEQALHSVNVDALTQAPNGVQIDADMRDGAAEWAEGFEIMRSESFNPRDWIEHSYGFTTKTCNVHCRIDGATYDGETLNVADYKYGWRLVEPRDNWQLIGYALGLILAFGLSPKFIVLHVCQPRPFHPNGAWRGFMYTMDEMRLLYKELSARLDKLDDALQTGPQCDRCVAAMLGKCPAFLRASHNAIDVGLRGGALDIPAEAVAGEYLNLQRAAEVIKQRLDWLGDDVRRKLTAGEIVPGLSLKSRKANRAWKDQAAALAATNIDLTKPGIVTPAEAGRRGMSEETLAALTSRADLPPAIVRYDAAALADKLGKPVDTQ